MKYKVKVDISKALPELKKLGVNSGTKAIVWVSVEADDPDGACIAAENQLYDSIIKSKKTTKPKEAAEIVKEKMSIVRIRKIK